MQCWAHAPCPTCSYGARSVTVTLVAIVRHDGRYGLVADDQDPVALGAFLYGVIRTGRWWRGIKPPPPKPRRAPKSDSNARQSVPPPAGPVIPGERGPDGENRTLCL